MKTVNAKLQDFSVSHQIDLAQLGLGVVGRMLRVLNATDADLIAKIALAMEKLPGPSFNVYRLDEVLSSVRATNAEAYRAATKQLELDLHQFAQYEAGYQSALLNSVLPAAVAARVTVLPLSADAVYTAAMAQPFQGRLLREWMDGLEATRALRIRDTIRIGFLEGQPTSQILQVIRGTRAAKYEDGIIQTDRRHAESVARTALSHVAGAMRDAMFERNDDIIKAVVWHSTLDMRTSSGCQVRDNKRYDAVSHKPIGHSNTWGAGPGRLHWRCRSSSYPVLKSWAELGIPIAELDATTRASMDGQVPADTSYGEWIKKQSAARQDEVLGPTRGKLMREGRMGFDEFFTARGQSLTLDQLRDRDAAAFRRAGV